MILRSFALNVSVTATKAVRVALLFACTAAVLAFAATTAGAATYGMTAFDLSPDTTQAGGHPTVTYYADFDAATAWSTGDDVKKVIVDYPAGLLGNPEAATTKCSESQYLNDSCPSASNIGTVFLTIKQGNSNILALGGVYVMAQTDPGAAATIAFIVRPFGFRKIFLKTKATGIVGVRGGVAGDYGLTLTIDNIPQTLTRTNGQVVDATLDQVWVQTPAKVNGKYFSFNPTRCTAAQTRVQGYSYKGITFTPRYDSFTPTGCDKVPFTPTGTVTPATTTIGAPTAWNATFNVPTADAAIQQSHVKNVTVDLPTGTTLNFDAIGAIPTTCTQAQLEADACPAGSKIGTASAAVPFLAPAVAGQPSMPGDIYLLSRLTSIEYGYVLRSKDGLKAALKGSIGAYDADNDNIADWIRATAIQLPQAPWSQVKMNFTTQLINNPAKCANTSVKSSFDGWSGKSATITNPVNFVPPAGGVCPGNNNLPQVSISSPANGSSSTSQNVPVTFTATDADASQTLSVKCELFNTSNLSLPLATDNACSSPKTFATGADGAYTIKVTATDSASPAGVATASVDVKVDSIQPNVVVTSPANDGSTVTTDSTTVGFTVQDASPSSGLKPVTCVLTRTAPTSATIGTDTNCITPKSYAGLTNGAYSFTVSAQDNAGNSNSAVRTFSVAIPVDTVAPSINITYPGAGATINSSTLAATWVITDAAPPGAPVSGINPSTVKCALSGPTNVAEAGCSLTGNTFTGLANGSYVLTVKASDNLGNPATVTRSFSVNVADNLAPTISITLPTLNQVVASSTVPATWTITDNAQPGVAPTGVDSSTVKCSLTGPTPAAEAPCSATGNSFTGLANGSYVLSVKASDNAGNPATATRPFSVSVVVNPPNVVIDAPTVNQVLLTNSVNAAWTVTPGTNPLAGVTCALAGPTATASGSCSATGKTFNGLANGDYTLSVSAADTAGNNTLQTRSFKVAVVDNIGPVTTITSPAENAIITTSSLSVSFSATDTAQVGVPPSGVAGFTCSISSAGSPGTPTSCVSPKQLLGLTNGDYTFTVFATDNAGNAGPPVSRHFTVQLPAEVDNVPPTINITAPTNAQVLTVNSAAALWTITDTAQIGVAPSGVNATSVTCGLVGSAGGTSVATTSCSVTGKTFSSLSNGNYVLTVNASDNATNANSATRSFSVNVPDNVAPSVTITAPSAGQVFTVANVTASWTTADTAQAGVPASGVNDAQTTCGLVGTAGGTSVATAPCPGNSKAFTSLTNGSYTLSVQTKDNAGNTSTTQTRAFSVNVPDTIAPTIAITAPTDGQVIATDSVNATWNLSDTAAPGVTPSGVNDPQTTCGLVGTAGGTSVATGPCTGGSKSFGPGLANGNYSLTVTAKDNAGNTNSLARSFVINRPIDNIAPTVSISTPTAGQTLLVSSASVAFAASDTAQPGAAVSGVNTVNCTLTNTSTSTVVSANAPCGTSPRIYTSLANGNYTVSIYATDNQGNSGASSPTTRSFTVAVPGDNQPPTINITAPTPGQNFTVSTVTAAWNITDTAQAGATVAGVDTSSVRCSLSGGPTAFPDQSCGLTGQTFLNLANGTYTLTVTAKDLAAGGGNQGSATRSFTVAVVDNVPPTINITAPTPAQVLTVNSAAATWSLTDTAQVGVSPSGVNAASVTCGLTGTAGGTSVPSAACGLTGKNFTSLSNGNYVLTVNASDNAGNANSATRSFSVAVPDAVPPTINITAPTAGQSLTTNSAAAVWAIADTAQVGVSPSGVNAASVTCGLSGPTNVPVASCSTTGKTFNSLDNGNYTLTVNASDNAGNAATPATRSFTIAVVDNVAPTVSITAPTVGQSFAVANVTAAWTTADTAQAGVPASGVNDAQTTCGLVGTGGGTTVPTAPCPGNSKAFTGLTNGSYTLTVQTKDFAGNTSIAQTRAFTVALPIDNVGPTVTITAPTDAQNLPTNSAAATWTLSDTAQPGAAVSGVKDSATTCALAGNSAGTTSVPSALCPGLAKSFPSLPNGTYTLTVVGFDNNNNSTTATRNFSVGVVDNIAPTVAISAPSAGQSFAVNSVNVSFSGTDTAQPGVTPSGIASYTCALSGPTPSIAAPCSAPTKSYTGLANGNYTVSIYATDNAGNSGIASPTTRNFTIAVIDNVAPTVNITAPGANATLTTSSVTATWTTADTAQVGVSASGVNDAQTTCGLTGTAGGTSVASAPCPGNSKAFTNLSNGNYTLTVQTKDNATNTSLATTRDFTVAVVDNVAPGINITAPTDGQILTVDSAAATWTLSDTAQAGVSASGVNDAATTCSLAGPTPTASGPCTGGGKTFTGLSNGAYILSVTAKDNANNSNTVTRNFSVNVVSVPPPNTTITTYGAASAPNTASLTVVATTDVGTGIQYSVDGTNWVACAFVGATKTGTCTVPLSTFTGPTTANYKIRAINTVPDASPEDGYSWIDNRPVKGTAVVTPVANASTTSMGVLPSAPGAHPDVNAKVTLEGSEDARDVTVQLPDGLMGSLAAVPKALRCTPRQGAEGNCPASAEIAAGTGTGVSVKYGALNGVGDVTGKVYMVDPDSPAADETAGFPDLPAEYAAGGAVEITSPSHPDLGRIVLMGYLKVIDNGRALQLIVTNLPRETTTAPEVSPATWVPAAARKFHASFIDATVNGAKGWVAPASATPTNPSRPLVTNPHYCGGNLAGRTLMKWVIGTAVTWNGTNISDGRTTPTVPAAAVGKVSSLYNTTLQSACMTNQAWNPQITNLSLTNPTAGSTTGLKADGLLGEEKDNGNKPISTAAYAFTQLPPFVGINANAFGAGLDQCAVETFVNPAGSGGERFDITVDRDPAVPGIQPACPPQAIMGTAYVDSPLIDTQLIGDIYFVIGSPIPNIGVRIAPDVEDPRWRAANEAGGANPYKRFPNPQGVNIGIVGRTGVENYRGNEWYPKVNGIDPDTGDPLPTTWHFGDCVPGGGQTCLAGVMLTISSLADVPISSLNLDIGDRKAAWRPRNDGTGNLEKNSLVVSGCADPTFPWTELDASSNPVRIGPPLRLDISPWGKVANSTTIADLPIQTNLTRKFQPITGCAPGPIHFEGEEYTG